jgi:hypothetical protein
MARIRIDPLVAETLERLVGTAAFLEALDKVVPEVEWQERESLKELAAEQNWDFGDFSVEQQILDEKFGRWIPTLAAYSVIILLHSAVEAQLDSFAGRVGRMQGSSFGLDDTAGRGIERAALYLKKVGGLAVKDDPAWPHLQNMQKLRNVIAHRGGKWTGTDAERERLLLTYPGKLAFRDRSLTRQELWISMNLCREFAQQTEGFFKRIFKAAGLPDKGVQFLP